MTIYDRIRLARVSVGMTQAELAKRTGYTASGMISQIENGKIDLSYSKIEEIASALGVPVEFLVTGQMTSAVKDRLKTVIDSLTDTEASILLASLEARKEDR